MKRLMRIFCAALVVAAATAFAESPEDLYVRVFAVIQEADALNDSGQPRLAMPKYAEAQATLARFPTIYPGWNEKVVKYRLGYVSSKLAPLVAQFGTNLLATPTPVPAVTPAAPMKGEAPDAYGLLRELQEELRRLQADKATLSAKLKEALSSQPAGADPREIAKAEQKNKNLQKENALLKVALTQEQSKSSSMVESSKYIEANRALAEAWGKIEEHTRALYALEQKNAALNKQLASLEKTHPAEAKDLRQQLQRAQSNLTSVQSLNEQLRKEKEVLEARVVDLTLKQSVREKDLEKQLVLAKAAAKNHEQTISKLQKEKSELELLLASGSSNSSNSKKVKQLQQDLDKALAASKEDRKLIASLQKERGELQSRLASASAEATQAEAKRRKSLENEVADLRDKLAKAEKQLSQKQPSKQAEVTLIRELETLRARLAVLEAKSIPYTSDELAALRKPEVQLALTSSAAKNTPAATSSTASAGEVKPASVRRTVKELPPGAGSLASAAQRAFMAKRFDEAEKNYLDILRQDEKNVFTLGNVAAIQIELNKLDEAEKHLLTALTLDPQDDFCLYLMGRVKFRRAKMDEALNLLSRAAAANPESAETQNYLGIVLSEKGMRQQAETAFRKAIQLQPGYGVAHNNLAFIYATQKPAALALAKWHYQKAIATGHPRNSDLEKLIGETK